MSAWWNSLSVLQQTLFVIGCATTLFMIAQIVLMLIGGGDTDADACDADVADVDPDAGLLEGDGACSGHGEVFTVFGLRILTVRTVIAFFSIGSWVAFTVDFVLDTYAAVLIGVAAGIAAAFLMAYLMRLVMRLQSSGNIDYRNSIGQTAEVYLTVPPARTGAGKLNLKLQERFVEVGAVTDCADGIPTGSIVRITGLADDDTVEVEPIGDNTRVAKNR